MNRPPEKPMQGCAYVDGQYIAPEDAKISIFDWGFLHSDATYDVAHVWQGRFFRLDDHLDRFDASLKALRLDTGHTRERCAR
jgi:branched-chain amino acid aminotransferase